MDSYLITSYLLITLFFSPIILLINLFSFTLLIKDLSKSLIANILAFTLPALLSYYLSLLFGNDPFDNFNIVLHSYLIINLLIGILTVPVLIKKNNQIDNKQNSLKFFYLITIVLFICVISFKLFYAPNYYSSKKGIFPKISTSIVDKSYRPPKQITNSKYIDVGYRLTWFYNATEKYIDSTNFDKNQGYFDTKYRISNRKLNSNINYQNDEIYLTVAEDEEDTINNIYKGFHLYLINTKTDTINFDGIDGNFYIVQQAKDLFGNWQNIEKFPNSWCGNSYYEISVPPNSYIRFTAPRYNVFLALI